MEGYVQVREERGSEKEEKSQGPGQATGGRRISVVAALLSAGGDGIPSCIRQAVASTPFL